MINFSLNISNSEGIGPGGLFDIDATLPLVMIQFLFLMFVLNTIFYGPILTVIEERKQYILNYLNQASNLLSETNVLIKQYEEEITTARKTSQLEIAYSQTTNKDTLEFQLNKSQKTVDDLLSFVTEDLTIKNDLAISNLDSVVKSLSSQIEKQLLI